MFDIFERTSSRGVCVAVGKLFPVDVLETRSDGICVCFNKRTENTRAQLPPHILGLGFHMLQVETRNLKRGFSWKVRRK